MTSVYTGTDPECPGRCPDLSGNGNNSSNEDFQKKADVVFIDEIVQVNELLDANHCWLSKPGILNSFFKIDF